VCHFRRERERGKRENHTLKDRGDEKRTGKHVHTFLKDAMSYSRVFGQQADCCGVVVQACKKKRAVDKQAAAAVRRV
jgi:hypothetical protein